MSFAKEHFPLELPTGLEWIDDSSANLVFATPAIASKALDGFSNLTIVELPAISALQLRSAKISSKNPDSSLQVRAALFTDRKRPRAYEASRFYMMHPELDPREQRRRDRSTQDNSGDYRRRRYGRDEHRRRKNGDSVQSFKPSMYDDDLNTATSWDVENASRYGSYSRRSTISSSDERVSGGERRLRQARRGDSYRPGRDDRSGNLSRDRSASPGRDKIPNRPGRRSRHRTPPPPYQTRDPYPTPRENQGKELFPLQPELKTSLNGTGKELFPQKMVSTNLAKELLPSKSGMINHRRSDAFDAADETADLFASRMSVPFADHDNSTKSPKESTAAPTSSFGRLKRSDSELDSEALENLETGGISIRGASKEKETGFSIRGTAANKRSDTVLKELFPCKTFGNAGKELFAEKINGRGGKRNKAEDMFY